MIIPTTQLFLLFFPGCSPTDEYPECDVSVKRHHATAATISFVTEEPKQVSVDVRQGDEQWTITEPEAIEVHDIPLLGLLPSQKVSYRVKSDAFECKGELDAKSLSGNVPSITVEMVEPESLSDNAFWLGAAISMSAGATPFVIDREGRFRWLRPGRPERIGGQIEFQKGTRAVLFNSFATDFTLDSGVLRTVNFEGETIKQQPAMGSHHVFVQLPDGTIAYPVIEIRDWFDEDLQETVSVIGDNIVELSPSGETTTIFSSWDWKEVQKHDHWTSSFYGDAHDWTHANALQYVEERDSYLITFPHLDTFLEIDRQTGNVVLEISPEGDIVVNGEFDHPHDVNWSDDGLLRLISHEEQGTVARAFSVESGRLELVWSYGENLGITGTVIGQHRRMNNGNVMVNFGGAGLMHEVSPNGDLLWAMSTELGYWLGNGQWFNDFYQGEYQ